MGLRLFDFYKQTNKNLRCGNRKGLLGRNDQTHHRMGPKTMESIPPSKRNTQADIQLRTRQTNHQQETDGCIQIKHNPEHQPSRMSSKSTAYVPPKTASTPTKAKTQTCSYLDFNQFLIRRITRNICLRLRIKQIQILTCREQDIRLYHCQMVLCTSLPVDLLAISNRHALCLRGSWSRLACMTRCVLVVCLVLCVSRVVLCELSLRVVLNAQSKLCNPNP